MQGVPLNLRILQPGHPDRLISLPEGELTLGRADGNQLILPDIGISRRHGKFTLRQGVLEYEDTSSGNGSYKYGERVVKTTLKSGDELVLDPFTLRVESVEDAGGLQAESTVRLGQAPPPPSVAEAEARLELVKGDPAMSPVYALTRQGLTLGRSEQRDVILNDLAASRLHAEILHLQGQFWLKDPGSANGVFVNGELTRERALRDGDLLRIGSTELRFKQTQAETNDEDAAERTEGFSASAPAPVRSAELFPASVTGSYSRAQLAAEEAQLAGPFTPIGGVPGLPVPPPAPPTPPPAPTPPPMPPPAPSLAAVVPPAPLLPADPTAPPSLPPSLIPPAWGPAAQTGAWVQAGPTGWTAPAPTGAWSPTGAWTPGAPTGAWQSPAAPEPAPPPAPAPPPRRRLLQPVLVATITFLLMAATLVIFKVIRDHTERPVLAANVLAPTVTPLGAEAAAEVKEHMAAGERLFAEERYYEATNRFIKALRLDPHNAEAKRLGYLACERIAVRELRESLEVKNATPAARAKVREDAVRIGEAALKGKDSLVTAEHTLRRAMKLNPDDKALASLDTKLRRKAAEVKAP